MYSVQSGFVKPSTGASPGFHTRPCPPARWLAYRMEIIASSSSEKYRSPSTTKLVR